MIYIARLYQARLVVSKIGEPEDQNVKPFTFENFPCMKVVFDSIEKHLDKVLVVQDTNLKNQSITVLLDDIMKDVSFCKKNHDAVGARIDGIKEKMIYLDKKVKALTKTNDRKRSRESEEVTRTKREQKKLKRARKKIKKFLKEQEAKKAKKAKKKHKKHKRSKEKAERAADIE